MSSEEDKQALAEELEDVALVLAEHCMSFVEQALEQPEEKPDAVFIETLDAEYERLHMTCELFEQESFIAVLNWARANLQQLAALSVMQSVQVWEEDLIFCWLELAAAYLLEPDEVSLLAELREALLHPAWPVTLDALVLEQLFLQLCQRDNDNKHIETETATVETPVSIDVLETVDDLEKAVADLEHSLVEGDLAKAHESAKPAYDLSWDEDIHPELLQAFFQEAPDQASELAALLRQLMQRQRQGESDDAQNSTEDAERYRHAARLAHTLKGSSSVVGIEVVTQLTHRLEDILEASQQLSLPALLKADLEASADCLESMFDALQEKAEAPEEYPYLQQKLEQWWQQLQVLLEAETISPVPTTSPAKDKANALVAEGKPLLGSQNEPTVRIPLSLVDRLLGLVEEMGLTTGRLFTQLEYVNQRQRQIETQDKRALQSLNELENSLDTMVSSSSDNARQHKLQDQAQSTLTITNSTFDSLEMDRYNEVHSANNALAESLADTRELSRGLAQDMQAINNLLHEQNRLNRELNSAVLDTRLVPVHTLVTRLERIVRETCRRTEKKARLEVSGETLALDIDVLRGLTDPLLHLLRNAVDHGIETPEERRAADKPEEGVIRLSFVRKANRIHICLSDDGRGMDTAKIRQRAIERHMMSAEETLDDDDVLKLILQPGFSTRDNVSTISGRGVGMDIVRTSIERLQGSLKLHSEAQKGSRIEMHLPMTLIAMQVLVVRYGQHHFALPIDSIEHLLYLDHSDLSRENEQWQVNYQEKMYPLKPLGALLGLPESEQSPGGATGLFIRDEKNNQQHVFKVDEVLQTREVLVKSLAPYLLAVPGVTGACMLMDGIVAPVLDVFRLLHFEAENFNLQHYLSAFPEHDLSLNQADILIVDDSLSNRKSLSLMVEQLNLNAVTAIDGLEALDRVDEHLPSLILTDLEMPRMNGLDLTRTLRNRVDTMDIPIVMITSRSTLKHQQEAAQAGVNTYLTKPVDSETLSRCVNEYLKLTTQAIGLDGLDVEA